MEKLDNKARNEYILKAKLYESTEKFNLMFDAINKFVELDPALSEDERTILNIGYKNIITNKRRTWRELIKVETEEKLKGNKKQQAYANELRVEIEEEILKSCNKILEMIDKYLIPKAKDTENKIYFIKMKADFLRYKAEVKLDSEWSALYKESLSVYYEAQQLANDNLPISNPIRLGIALNLSVLWYEVIAEKESAIKVAKSAYDEAIKIIDDLDKNKSKETILIIQLLKDNLSLWNNDNEEGTN